MYQQVWHRTTPVISQHNQMIENEECGIIVTVTISIWNYTGFDIVGWTRLFACASQTSPVWHACFSTTYTLCPNHANSPRGKEHHLANIRNSIMMQGHLWNLLSKATATHSNMEHRFKCSAVVNKFTLSVSARPRNDASHASTYPIWKKIKPKNIAIIKFFGMYMHGCPCQLAQLIGRQFAS